MGVFWIIIAIIIISSLVGALAKFLNNMNELQAGRNRPPAGAGPAPGGGGPVVRQSTTDMDRFLAEIDRLRRKNAEAAAPPAGAPPVAPVVQPPKAPERQRSRVVAELVEPVSRPDLGFVTTPPSPPGELPPPRPGALPVATVVTPPSETGAPATRVTRIAGRPRPAAKTPFAKNLTTILNSGQGLALAIVLQEILGPPVCKKR